MKTLVLLGVVGIAATANAQCRPPANTHEARLLAFYEAPLVFSFLSAPRAVAAGAVTLGAEAGNVPSPSAELRRPEYCYQPHSENTTLTPAYGRPRVTVGLPAGVALEASYLPPVPVGGATPNLASLAFSRPVDFTIGDRELTVALRAHGTLGSIRGSITCPASALQTGDPSRPCYGTRPSGDTFFPRMVGTEAAVATRDHAGRLSVYAGAGVTWLGPRFRVGFTDLEGNLDASDVQVSLARASVFGGFGLRATDAVQLSGQLYSVPQDVTTLRIAVEYRVR